MYMNGWITSAQKNVIFLKFFMLLLALFEKIAYITLFIMEKRKSSRVIKN